MAISDVFLVKSFVTAGFKLLTETGGEAARMAAVRAVGNEGERRVFQATGYIKNTRRIPAPSGTAKYRVPDILDDARKVIGDVKNVAYQDLDGQLSDLMKYAKANGYTYELWLRSNTQLGPALQQAIAKGEIVAKVIPGL